MTTPRPACAGDWLPYDAVQDAPTNRYARQTAARICHGCDLKETCLPTHLALGEIWAKAVLAELAAWQKGTRRRPGT